MNGDRPACPAAARRFPHTRLLGLGSLRTSAVLLVLLAAVLMGAGLLRISAGADVVNHYIFRTFWFNVLLFLLGLNVLCAALSRRPWRLRHLSFLAAHGGILILLTGALVGHQFGMEIQLDVALGQTVPVGADRPLGFTLQLDQLDPPELTGPERNPERVAHLRLIDSESGEVFLRALRPNASTRYGGFTLSRLSRLDGPADTISVLAARDPGWPLKALGGGIIVAGILSLFYLQPFINRRVERATQASLPVPAGPQDHPLPEWSPAHTLSREVNP